jgi:hypothetical protein
MKKNVFVVAVFCSIVLSACSKDYTCTCTDKNNQSVIVTDNVKVMSINPVDKTAKETMCKTNTYLYSDTSNLLTNCKLQPK